MGLAAGAGIAAAGSLAGGAISAGAAGSAASQQAATTKLGLEQQQAMYQANSANLAPYFETGQNALALGNQLIPYTTAGGTVPTQSSALALPGLPASMTEDQLKQTPGYQFTLDQGLQSTQNAAAARGLGVSGAALKAAAGYATGLADNTYQNQFNIEQQQYSDAANNTALGLQQNNMLFGQGQSIYGDQIGNEQNMYNQLAGYAQLGEGAASAVAGVGANTANSISSGLNALGNAQAAGTVGTANALSGAFSGASGSLSQYLMLNKLLGNNQGLTPYTGPDFSYAGTPGSAYTVPGSSFLGM